MKADKKECTNYRKNAYLEICERIYTNCFQALNVLCFQAQSVFTPSEVETTQLNLES